MTADKQTPESPLGDQLEEMAQANDESGQEETQSASGDEALLKALAEAEEQSALHRDAMLRMQAEMENLRKRMSRDLDRSRKRALEGFMNDLLPVMDSLAKGLEAAEESASIESLKEGKSLILRMLGKAMQDHGLVQIDPKGEVFNPELHEAISMLPSPDHAENEVMEVVQKGYQLNERLIRPARVVVSSGTPGN